LNKVDNMKNRMNCWKLLKSFCHNETGNGKRDGLKSERINGQSAANPLKDYKSMGQVQRLMGDVNQQIIPTRASDTKVMI